MKKLIFSGALLLMIYGCSNDPLSDQPQTEYESMIGINPNDLKIRTGEFTSPLFDLSSSPNGDLLVADAGSGISNIHGASQISLPGVTNIAPIGGGSMWAITGPSGDPKTYTGQALYRVSNGKNRMIANLFAYEKANDPDGMGVESNPYSVVSLNGRAALVVDAAANDLIRVDNQGNIELIAVFPNELVSTSNVKSLVGCPNPEIPLCGLPPMLPAQAVPTSVVIGPDGYYYVGELKGFPAPTGESNIWKISPDASGAMCGSSPDCVKAFDGGFTSIIDMVFGEDGKLYVAELDEKSWFAAEVLQAGAGGTIKACNPDTMECEIIATGIPLLTAIEFGKDGSLWATRYALTPGLAEVFKVAD